MTSNAQKRENGRLRTKIAELDAAIEDRDAKIETLARQLRALEDHVKRLLATRHRAPFIARGQGVLFPLEPVSPEQSADDESSTGESSCTDDVDNELAENSQADDEPTANEDRTKRKPGSRKLDTSALPYEERRHELPEHERFCPDTGLPLVPIGETVFDEIDYQRARIVLIRHRRTIYGLATGASRGAPGRAGYSADAASRARELHSERHAPRMVGRAKVCEPPTSLPAGAHLRA